MPDGKIQKLASGKDEIISLLPDKKAELSAFIDEKRLKCRNVDDYRKVIAYYNSPFLIKGCNNAVKRFPRKRFFIAVHQLPATSN